MTTDIHMNNYLIQCADPNDPYAPVIVRFIEQEFPQLVRPGDGDIIDLLTDALVSTGQVRLGPKPSLEGLVEIRRIMRHWMDGNQPIPLLVGWGSEKPDGSSPDVAELFAVQTLAALRDRVAAYYLPGLLVHVRVEDASAPFLFYERANEARQAATIYTTVLTGLPGAMGLDGWLKFVAESTLTTEASFNQAANGIMTAMLAHIKAPADSGPWDELFKLGWRQPLSRETIGFYLDRYAKLYPGKTTEQQQYILARYFASALARINLGITGADQRWGKDFIDLSFVGPTPGIDASRALRRIYYRTMPSALTSSHLPAWRAKGYLAIGDTVHAKLASWQDVAKLALTANTVLVGAEGKQVGVRADYVVE